MRGTRLMGIGAGVLAVFAAVVTIAPAVKGQQVGVERLMRDNQNRLLTVGPDIQVLTTGGPQIGIGIRDAEKGEGVEVTEVRSGSPASKAGFRTGDIIVEFDGERVRSAAQLTRLVRETPAGRTVKAVVTRDGKRVDLSVTPEDRAGQLVDESRELLDRLRKVPDRVPLAVVPRGEGRENFFSREPYGLFVWPGRTGRLGVTVETLTDQLATYFGAKDGVLVTEVTEGSAAAKAGLKAGDVITAIDDKPVNNASELARLVRGVKDGAEITIAILRDRRPQTLKATLKDASASRRVVVRRGIRM